MLKLKKIATMTAYVESVTTTGRMDMGVRQLYVVRGGKVSGERINGEVLAGGGDNLLVDPGGLGHVDARVTWKTDDGAVIYMQYFGRVELNDETAAAFQSGKGLPFGKVHFVTQPRFECGHPRYEWLNHTVAIAEGRVAENSAIEYNIYACEIEGIDP